VLLLEERFEPLIADGTAIRIAVARGTEAAVDRLLADSSVGAPGGEDGEDGKWLAGVLPDLDSTPAVARLLAEPRVLLHWPLPAAAQPLLVPALARAAWARRRHAVMAWESSW
jgi:hypothetical protein